VTYLPRIDKDVPMSRRRHGREGKPNPYPFGLLEVGDSFFVPVAETDTKLRRQVAGFIEKWKKAYDGKFSVRWRHAIDEKDAGFEPLTGYRVWRTK
jgi:hypothetical protein